MTAFVTFNCVSSLIFDLSGRFVFICALSYLMSEKAGSELVATVGHLTSPGAEKVSAALSCISLVPCAAVTKSRFAAPSLVHHS